MQRTPRQENTAPANTPKSTRQSFARTPNGNAPLLYSRRQVTSEWCTLPQSARGVLEAQGSPDGACNPPNGCGTRTRRVAGANGAYAQCTVYIAALRKPRAQCSTVKPTCTPRRGCVADAMCRRMRGSGGTQALESRHVMDTRPLPGLGDAPTRCATHRKTAARARGARLVQTGHTRSAQASLLPISGPLRSARAIAPPVRRELATRNAAGPPHAAQKQRPTKLAWRSHHQASASPPLGHSE